MATTKKSTKAADIAVENIEQTIVSDSVENVTETKAVEEKKIKKEKKVFTDSDYITCRSVWSGGLNIISQSGNTYRFNDYGDECDINYRDLKTMIKRGSEHIKLPRFIILDEDFLEEFPTVKKIYGEMYTMDDLQEILELPVSRMKTEIAKLPDTTKGNMCNLVATQIANGKLDSISKVRALTSIFGFDFNLLSELFVK